MDCQFMLAARYATIHERSAALGVALVDGDAEGPKLLCIIGSGVRYPAHNGGHAHNFPRQVGGTRNG